MGVKWERSRPLGQHPPRRRKSQRPSGSAGSGLQVRPGASPRGKTASPSPQGADPLPDEKGEQTGGSGGARRIELFLRPANVLLFSHGSASRESGAPGSRDAHSHNPGTAYINLPIRASSILSMTFGSPEGWRTMKIACHFPSGDSPS